MQMKEVVSVNGQKVLKALPSSLVVDTSLSSTSSNPVQNKVVTEAINGKVDNNTANGTTLGLQYRYENGKDVIAVKLDNSKFDLPLQLRHSEDQSSATILSRIIADGNNFGSLGATNCSDAPNTGEWTVFWFGSVLRKTVIASAFPISGETVYVRDLYNNNWYTGWRKMAT